MNADMEVVNLSSDEEVSVVSETTKTKTPKIKWNDLHKYIPFLEYVTKQDPVKHNKCVRILHFLKTPGTYADKITELSDKFIKSRYAKLKTTMNFPPHIVDAFKVVIVISDEEDDQKPSNQSAISVNTLDVSKDKETSDENKNSNPPDEDSTTSKCSAIDAAENNTSNKTQKSAVTEEGEIVSDDCENNIPSDKEKTITTALEDDILNQDLFQRIDSLGYSSDSNDRSSVRLPSWKKHEKETEGQLQKSLILRQSNKEPAANRSPHTVLSPVSDDESILDAVQEKKKKKKKRKKNKSKSHHRSDWFIAEVENNSQDAGAEKSIKHKIMRRNSVANDEKRKENSKKQKEEPKLGRLLSISDDEDDEIPVVATEASATSATPVKDAPSSEVISEVPLEDVELKLFERRDPNRKKDNIVPKIIELDSDADDDAIVPSTMNSVRPLSLPNTIAQPDVTPTKDSSSSPNKVADINDMALPELENIYSTLSKTTGIELEDLLPHLLAKSVEDGNSQTLQNCKGDISNLNDIVSYTLPNNKINFRGNDDEDMTCFAAQQHEPEPYMQQKQQTHQFQHQQQQQYQQQQGIQMHYPPDQIRCTTLNPMPYPNPNNLRPGLNLKDPRIVQQLNKMKDSPIYNIDIRASASTLINSYTSAPQRENTVVKAVTSKTAKTYGEYTRLRELEKQKKIDHEKANQSVLISNNTVEPTIPSTINIDQPETIGIKTKSTNLNQSEKGRKSVSIDKDVVEPTRTNSTGSESGRNTPNDSKQAVLKRISSNSSERNRKDSASSDTGGKTPRSSEKNNVNGTVISRRKSVSIDKCVIERKRTNSTDSTDSKKTVRNRKVSATSDSSGRAPRSSEKGNVNGSEISRRKSGSVDEDVSKGKRINSTGSEENIPNSSRKVKDSVTSDSGRKTPKPSEKADQKRKYSSSLDNGRTSQNSNQNQSDDEVEVPIMSFPKRKTILRIKSSSSSDSDDTATTPSAMTKFEREKVMDIVLSAMVKTEENVAKVLGSLSKTTKSVGINVKYNEEGENYNKSTKPTEVSPRKKKISRSKSIDQNMQKAKKNASQQRKGHRELNNLLISLESYRDMFKINSLPTIDGKRTCASAVRSMAEDQIETIVPVAAPIRRRRQTCSVLQRPSSPQKNTSPPKNIIIRRISATCEQAEQSSDTDEFDIEEHRKVKRPVDQDPFPSRLQIQLNNLSPNEIKKLSKPKNSEKQHVNQNVLSSISKELVGCQEIPILHKLYSKPVQSPSIVTPQIPYAPNTATNMTVGSTKICVICNKRPLVLTDHFVNIHKSESYTSRLTLSEIFYLENHTPRATMLRKKHKITCFICQDNLEQHFSTFYDHFSTHTGEFAYKCNVCGVFKPYVVDIRSHQLHSNKCRNGKIRLQYSYDCKATNIFLYMCTLCNFCQLNEANIHKHQRDHHSFRFDEPHHVKKFVIATIDVEVANELLPDTCDDEIAITEENLTAEEEEQNIVDYPLDIKDFLLTEDSNSETLSASEMNGSVSYDKKEEVTDLVSLSNVTKGDLSKKPPEMTTPEALLEKLHAPLIADNIMTVIHCGEVPPKNHCQPYEEPVDCKPNINEISIYSLVNVKQIKPRVIYRKTNPNSKYWGMYKCMMEDCWFSTNVAESFLKHVTSHEDKGTYICAYCSLTITNAEKLIRHVRTRHSSSRFQCSECTYRSFTPGNVIIHQRLDHMGSTADKCIYECVGRLNNKINTAKKKKMETNVSSIKCPECDEAYYAISSIKLHIAQSHPLYENKCHMYNMFACMYCKEEYNSLPTMQIHMATEHPDTQNIVVMRELSTTDSMDASENLKIIDVSTDVLPTDIQIATLEECTQLNESSKPEPIVNAIKSPTSSAKLFTECKEDNEKLAIEENTSMYRTEVHNTTIENHVLLKAIKEYLDLFTENTGIVKPDLYSCSHCKASFFHHDLLLKHVQKSHNVIGDITCPYCAENFSLEEIASHIISHGRHLYVCIECMKTFSSRKKTQAHIKIKHSNTEQFIEQRITHDFQSYYVFQRRSVVIDQKYADEMRNNYIQRVETIMYSEWMEGLTSKCLEEVDIPQFKNTISLYKCLVECCTFVGANEEDLDNHLNIHGLSDNYNCLECALNLSKPSWEVSKNHEMLHRGELIICSVCKFLHHNRLGMKRHIVSFHNLRAVPVISLSRDAHNHKISLSIVLPAGKSTLKTACFCCQQKLQSSAALLYHLKTQHNITLHWGCLECDKILLTQEEIKQHAEEHDSQHFKLKYKIFSTFLYSLAVQSICPFSVEVNPKREKRTHLGEDFSSKRIRMDDQHITKIKEEVFIKTECDETEPDERENVSGLALKCKEIGELVSKGKTTEQRPNISIKKTSDLQMPVANKVPITTPTFYATPTASTAVPLLSPAIAHRPADTHPLPPILPHQQVNGPSAVYAVGSTDHETPCCCALIPELMAICKHCKTEYTNFCQLTKHYAARHAPNHDRFLYRIARKIKCMHCSFRGSLRALPEHHMTFHPHQHRLCCSVLDPKRCGVCHGIFGEIIGSQIPKCACPMSQRTLKDCLNSRIHYTLETFGQNHAIQCALCDTFFCNKQEYSLHISAVHNGSVNTYRLTQVESILYLCNFCDKMQHGIREIIEHYRTEHLSGNVTGSFAGRMNYYNKIEVVYPKGLILSISQTQFYNEDNFKRDIEYIEGQYNLTNR